MAKKQAGLQPILGRADTSLIAAAGAAAQANVPKDLSKIFQGTADAHANLMQSISDNFAKIELQVANNNEEMKDYMSTGYDQVYNGTFTDAQIEDRLGRLKDLETEWKAIPRGKKGESERAKWKNKANKYFGEQKTLNETMMTIATLSKNNQLEDLDPGEAKLFTGIANMMGNLDPNGPKATETYDETTGKTTYSITYTDENNQEQTISKTGDELKNLIPVKYHAASTHIEEQMTKILNSGAKKGLVYEDDEKIAVSQGVVNFIEGTDQPDAAWRTLQTYKSGTMTESFKQALYNKDSLGPQILVALEAAGQLKDVNNDGDINQEDVNLVTKENYNKLVKGILSDRKAGAKIYADWWAATEGQAQFDKGYKTRDLEEENEVDGISLLPTKGKSTKTDIFNNNKWTPNSEINQVGLKINNRDAIALSGGNKYVFFEDENTYFLIDNSGKQVREVKDKNEIFTNVFGGDEDGLSGGFRNSDFYQSVLDFGKKEKLDLPKDMLGEDVPGGIYPQTLQSSTGVIEEIRGILVPSAVVEQVRQGLNPDYYGDRDRIRVTIPDADGPGQDYVYEFDAGGNSDAVTNAKQFNSNLKKYFK
jgi:hypothetical protein